MMVKAWQTLVVLLGVWAVSQQRSNTAVEAQVSGLSPDFYDDTCPEIYDIVADGVFLAILNQTRNAASLLRLLFHDCFVQGCDGSILLAATATIPSEQTALPNNNSARGYNYIYDIKAVAESVCPGVVSCADIIALSSVFSVILTGGPSWAIPLGRRDSFLAAPPNTVLTELVAPNVNITTLKQKFAFQNLSITDVVALSGAHTIGIARCASVIGRIYNFTNGAGPTADPTLNTTLLKKLEKSCPFTTTNQTIINTQNPMDIVTPTLFDNYYYKNLLENNGVFQSDQELYDASNDTKALVELYASDQDKFFEDFVQSMNNMGNLNVLTGSNGEIRLNCSIRNSDSDSSFIRQVVDEDSEQQYEPREPVNKIEKTAQFFQKIVKKVQAKFQAEAMVEEFTHWKPLLVRVKH